MTSISLPSVQISLSRSLRAFPSDWKKFRRSAMSNREVSYPIDCTMSGRRESWGSSFYPWRSVSSYTSITFVSSSSWSWPATAFRRSSCTALVDLEVLLVKFSSNTFYRHINCWIIHVAEMFLGCRRKNVCLYLLLLSAAVSRRLHQPRFSTLTTPSKTNQTRLHFYPLIESCIRPQLVAVLERLKLSVCFKTNSPNVHPK